MSYSPEVDGGEAQLLRLLQTCSYEDTSNGLYCALDGIPPSLCSDVRLVQASLMTYSPVYDLCPLFPFLRRVACSVNELVTLDLEVIKEVCREAQATPFQYSRLTSLLPQFQRIEPTALWRCTQRGRRAAAAEDVNKLDAAGTQGLLVVRPPADAATSPAGGAGLKKARGPPPSSNGAAATTSPTTTTTSIPSGSFPLGNGAELLCQRCNPYRVVKSAAAAVVCAPHPPPPKKGLLPKSHLAQCLAASSAESQVSPRLSTHLTAESATHLRSGRRGVVCDSSEGGSSRNTSSLTSAFPTLFDPFAPVYSSQLPVNQEALVEVLECYSPLMLAPMSLSKGDADRTLPPPQMQRRLDGVHFAALFDSLHFPVGQKRVDLWSKLLLSATGKTRGGKRRARSRSPGRSKAVPSIEMDFLVEALLRVPSHSLLVAIFRSFAVSCPWLMIEEELVSIQRTTATPTGERHFPSSSTSTSGGGSVKMTMEQKYIDTLFESSGLSILTFEDWCETILKNPFYRLDEDDEHRSLELLKLPTVPGVSTASFASAEPNFSSPFSEGTELHWSLVFLKHWLLLLAAPSTNLDRAKPTAQKKKKKPQKGRSTSSSSSSVSKSLTSSTPRRR